MAKFKRGILGGFQGKVGTVIGSRWKNVNVMRAMPEHVRDARSEKQLTQREKFRVVSSFLRLTRPFIRAGFEISSSANYSSNNRALSYNLRYGTTGEYPEPGISLDFPSVRIAEGSLEGALNATAQDTGSGGLDISWEDNSGDANAQGNDTVMLLAYSEQHAQAVIDTEAAIREDGAATLSLPNAINDGSGATLHVWIAFRNGDSETSSNSTYLGSISL
jgi:hypothetical protein